MKNSTVLARRATRAEIDGEALRHNLAVVRQCVGPGVGIIAVVKANAYGHDAELISRLCLEAGVAGLAVATVDEGLELRRAGIEALVMVLAPTIADEHEVALAHQLTLTVGSLEMGRELAQLGGRIRRAAHVQVQIDTGLNRFGIPVDRAVEEVTALAALPHLIIDGIFTHFAGSEEADKCSALQQLALFNETLEALAERDLALGCRHAANSGAVLELPESHFDLVRPGIMLYGYHPAGLESHCYDLRPVLRLRSCLTRLEMVQPGAGVGYNHTFRAGRVTRLGLVPIGYADGLPRLLANRGAMLVRGQRCPIVGRVSMDQTILDVTDLPEVALGDEVVIIGRQGAAEISAEEIATLAHTNAYETLCRISVRVPRIGIGQRAGHEGESTVQ